MLLQNIRSLSKNFDEFKKFQENEKQATAICLTEMWLKQTVNKQIFNLANYRSLLSSERKKRGGSVGIFVNWAAKAKLLAKLEKVSIQAISVLINYRGTELVKTCVYIPPNCTNEATFSTLGSYIDEKVLLRRPGYYFFSRRKKHDKLISTLSAIGFSFVPSQDATRKTYYSKTLFDVFFTNFKSSQKVLKTAVNDHYIIKKLVSENTKLSNRKCKKIRVWSKLQNTHTINQIRAKIASYSNFLLRKKLTSFNGNESLIKIQDLLNIELNKIILERKPSVRNKRNYIDNEVQNSATEKQNLSAKEKYENQSKVEKKFVRKKVRQYYKKINKKAGQNTQNFFDAVKK